MSAPFIVFEGPEGAGKSGQIARVADGLESSGRPHIVTREPGGTPIGERIREQLLAADLEVPPVTELLLFAAQRAAHVQLVIRPAIARGTLVLSDRYALSTRVYQGSARGLDMDLIDVAADIATSGLEPDLYVILDVDPAVGRSRQAASGASPDRIEREDLDFMARVREGYRDYALRNDNAELVDAAGAPDDVAKSVRAVLSDRFPDWFPGRP